MIKVISLITVILFFILLPPAILALASQDALPGETLYPVKRSLENGILTIASMHPSSRAWFSLGYTNRRFSESKRLINRGEALQVKNSLNDLVTQTTQVAGEIQTIQNQEQKRQLIVELNKSINEYQQGLNQAKQQSTTITTQPSQPPQPDQRSQPPQPKSTLIPSPTTRASLSNTNLSNTSITSVNSINKDIDQTIKQLDEIEEILEEEENDLDFLEDQELDEDDEDDERGNRGRRNGDESGRDDEHEGRGRGKDD